MRLRGKNATCFGDEIAWLRVRVTAPDADATGLLEEATCTADEMTCVSGRATGAAVENYPT